MGKGSLSYLVLLNVEREETEKIDHIIDQFASVQARKVKL